MKTKCLQLIIIFSLDYDVILSHIKQYYWSINSGLMNYIDELYIIIKKRYLSGDQQYRAKFCTKFLSG